MSLSTGGGPTNLRRLKGYGRVTEAGVLRKRTEFVDRSGDQADDEKQGAGWYLLDDRYLLS